jgi:hypothetical protein
MVELPSKPQLGRSARVGGFSNDLIAGLAAQTGNRLLAVKPDVFQFVFFIVTEISFRSEKGIGGSLSTLRFET